MGVFSERVVQTAFMATEVEIARLLRSAATQVLENYQRAGIRRFVGASLPQIHGLRELLAESGAGTARSVDAASDAVNPVSSGSRQEQQVAVTASARASVAAAKSNPPLGSASASAERGEWTLPILDLDQRSARFAELEQQVRACRKCSEIVNFRHQTVFGVGPLQPTVCFMGEAPGADEDRQGEPFVGKAGQLLTKIISAMKLKREEVYILNALKCRPPQNRTPVPDEIGNCRPFVETQLEVLQPKYIVCLGAVAVRSVIGSEQSIGRLRGRFHSYRGARVVVTYHPSYLLRNESAKRLVWEDMQMLMRELGTLS